MMMVLVSAAHQDEPAIGVHMSPPSEASLPPAAPSHPCSCLGAPGLSSLRYAANPHWLCLSHTIMCVSMLLSQFIPPSPSPTWSTSVFSMPASPRTFHLFLKLIILF